VIRGLLGDEVSNDFAEDAQLLTSELVTNAVMYAPSGCKVSAWYAAQDRVLRVEVSDGAADAPRMGLAVPPTQVSGRGLHIVASRSSDWGVEARPCGKSVWFELRG
jgi:anti-sigma regulatory factor (Ser/Thr protein kinase)